MLARMADPSTPRRSLFESAAKGIIDQQDLTWGTVSELSPFVDTVSFPP
jgi:hypothetical protein